MYKLTAAALVVLFLLIAVIERPKRQVVQTKNDSVYSDDHYMSNGAEIVVIGNKVASLLIPDWDPVGGYVIITFGDSKPRVYAISGNNIEDVKSFNDAASKAKTFKIEAEVNGQWQEFQFGQESK